MWQRACQKKWYQKSGKAASKETSAFDVNSESSERKKVKLDQEFVLQLIKLNLQCNAAVETTIDYRQFTKVPFEGEWHSDVAKM